MKTPPLFGALFSLKIDKYCVTFTLDLKNTIQIATQNMISFVKKRSFLGNKTTIIFKVQMDIIYLHFNMFQSCTMFLLATTILLGTSSTDAMKDVLNPLIMHNKHLAYHIEFHLLLLLQSVKVNTHELMDKKKVLLLLCHFQIPDALKKISVLFCFVFLGISQHFVVFFFFALVACCILLVVDLITLKMRVLGSGSQDAQYLGQILDELSTNSEVYF
ncbi:hypothetical protein ACJX0J_024625, partial [Zea mays]